MVKVMAVNAGSSSLKYKVYEMPEEKALCSGNVERIGHEDGIFGLKVNGEKIKKIVPVKDHGEAVEMVLKALLEYGIVKSYDEIKCVGHRVVQGGKYFSKSADFDENTEAKITKLIPLDPMHAKAALTGFHAFKKALPHAYHIAVFDTAFHQTMEPEDYVYPIPYEWTEKYDCRRYGAHGTSHHYLALKGNHDFLNDAPKTKIITCHIGSGGSLAAVYDGKCVATSMGLTPLGGIMMGTRSGDMDPSVFYYLCQCTGETPEEIYQDLNKKSGILGVSGVSNDTRDVQKAAEEGNERAKLGVALYARRVADFLGQYFVRLGGADLIVFSAGVGENAPMYRREILTRVQEALGLSIDWEANGKAQGIEMLLSKPDSKIKVAVIPTDEEVMIARDCYARVNNEL